MWARNASHGAEQVQDEVDVGSGDTEMTEACIKEMIALACKQKVDDLVVLKN
jgi:pyruvate dehydrogenase complex dehydrogenase (E1) component